MKRSNISTLFLGFALVLFTLGCSTDDKDILSHNPLENTPAVDNSSNNGGNNGGGNPVVGGNIQNVLNAMMPDSETFTVDASNPIFVSGSQGTTLELPGGSLIHQNGTTVTGNVDIEMLEIYTKADMILANKPTIASGGTAPLISGGEVFIKVSQAGEWLSLNTPASIYMPTAQSGGVVPGMMIFQDGNQAQDVNTLNVDWQLNTNNPAGTMGVSNCQDSTQLGLPFFDNYCFDIDSLGWVNCDVFMNDPNPQTTVSATVTLPLNDTNTAVFVVATDDNMACGLSGSGQVFSTAPNYTLPETMNITIVGIAEEPAGQFHSAFLTTTVTTNMNPTLTFSPTTLADFEADLNAL